MMNLKWPFECSLFILYVHLEITWSIGVKFGGDIKQAHPQWDCHLWGDLDAETASVANCSHYWICEQILIMTKF